jgi:minor extracellular protease Epr
MIRCAFVARRRLGWRLAGLLAAMVMAWLAGILIVRADDDRFDDRDDAREVRADDSRAGGGASGSRDADPDPGGGAGMRLEFERDEIVATGLSPEDIETLRARGFTVLHQRNLGALDLTEARLRIPRAYSPESATAYVRSLSGAAAVDANHLYRPAADPCTAKACLARSLVAWPAASPGCGPLPTVGLIDTGVATDHPLLRGAAIESHSVRSPDRKASAPAHGTAVASVLAGRDPAQVPSLLADAKLIAVDAFHGTGASDRMDAFDLLAAIDFLMARKVRLINLSFAGPGNSLVEKAVQVAQQRGVILVAAVGNDGPNAKPLFPAAYESVIGVTAVDAGARPYRRAVQGGQVEFAAPGVDLPVANAGGWLSRRVIALSGTSMAAPFVTASAARILAASPTLRPDDVRRRLAAGAKDLGAAGRDAVFGHGLVQVGEACDPSRRTSSK